MPMMRDTLVLPLGDIALAQGLGQVVDHGAEIGPRGERLLEDGEDRRALRRRRSVPARGERTAEPGVLVPQPCPQPVALPRERRARGIVERARRRLGPGLPNFTSGQPPLYAENEVPHPQDDFALGFTNVKPPVSPWVT